MFGKKPTQSRGIGDFWNNGIIDIMPIMERHKRVLKKMSKNVGLTRNDAMVAEGYKKTYIDSGNIAETDSWKLLMEKELPDSLLAKRHKELLNKREVIKEFNDITGLYDKKVIDEPDTQAVSKGLEMAYKLKRKYPTEGGVSVNTVIISFDESLRASAKGWKESGKI